jgi:large subunit ribosomal protein L25
VPGVIYGDSITAAASVKFEEKAIKKVISNHGSHAKLWIKYNDNKKFGFIREVQRQPMTGNLIHLDIQIVSKDHEIKRQIPIVVKGEDDLKGKQLQLQINKSEIAIFGKMALMPDTIFVDVSDKDLGDTITLNNFELDALLKNEDEDTVFGVIVNLRNQLVEEEVVEEEEK